ncbi:protein kinase domain-containing protein [Streptomyces acidiscabies]|uniref:protein kinase domain-containing protein n=1 Tax=Streptomyces acidiscabies TaxID=42234 RepID=UPI0038F7BAF8
MAQQQRSQGPSDPEATDGGMSDAPEQWGNGGLVGDGRYRLTRRLGRGGMAEVFAAEDVRLGRTVAVKLLRSDLAEDPTSKARFTREAQSVAGLNHHSIVAVYDSGEDVMANGQAVPYIVMEIVEGRTIRDLLLNAEAPGPEQALIIVSGVLEALAYSHQHGIVHRDIKPANVIITHNGAVKVMDFGIARALHGASTTMTQTGMVMGTPQYLSPEQALGKAVDHRSDLYATGCMLYELLALRPPFVGETPLSVVYQHVQDIPVPPSQASGGASPPELDGLAMRALAKEPDDRFQTAEEMRGLVQYGLQMLYDHGPHTGTWNTGPVTAPIAAHPVTGGYSSTTMMPQGGHGGATSQIPQPILPQGYGSGDDGGFEGHGNHGSGRGKLWILAVLAIIAIAAGVALALQSNGDKGGGTDTTPTPTVSSSTSPDSSSPSPSETESDDSGDSSTENSTTSGGSGDYSDPSTPKPTPTPTKTQEQSSEPTPSGDDSPEPSSDPATTGDTSTGTTNQGSTGTSSGTNSGGTSDGGPPNGGTSEGGTTGLGGLTGG